MFNLEKSIKQWLKSFYKYEAFQHGSIVEMEQHLRDHIDDLIGEGVSEEMAFERAIKEFGSPDSLVKEVIYSNKPIYKSNRLMLSNYFKIAFRNFTKHRSYALLNVMGLTVGLVIVFLIGLFVTDELSFDQFHIKKNHLYRVVENQYYAGQPVFPVAVTPTALGPSLEHDYPEIVRSVRMSQETYQFEQSKREIIEPGGLMADGHLFQMFSFDIVEGDVSTFSENLNALVLNENLAKKYFPEKSPIGELMTLNNEEYEVLAVMKNVPKNSHLEFEYVTNFEKYVSGDTSRANNWRSNWLYTYVELDPQADLHQVNEKIREQIKTNNPTSITDIYLQPLNDIYLGEVDFTVEVNRKGEMMYVKIFTIVAIFILLISCINFMNLSTARSAKRAKEVGLRKVVGASRSQLVVQFLSESILMSILSVILALLMAILLLPAFNQITGKTFEWTYLLNLDNGVKLVMILIVSTLFTGLFAGSYPAFVLSAIRPIKTLNAHDSVGRGSWLRKGLVVFQFTISVILIIGTLVVYSQFSFIQNTDLGYDKNHIIYTYISGDQSKVFAEKLRSIAGIENVGLSNRHPGYVLSSSSGFNWPGKNKDETVLMHFMGIDEHYVPTMKIRLKEGRNFLASDSATLLINERASDLMGMEDPVGQTIEAYGERKIVGIVDDFNFKSIHHQIEPIVIFKLDALPRVYIKYDQRQEKTILASIESVWDEMFPNQEFSPYFLDEDFNEMYEAEERTGRLSTYFAFLAIFISCLGLFGLVAYAVDQRKKEIGVRKVLGASTSKLFVLLSSDFTKLVMLSLLLATPVGWIAMDSWLDNYAYRIDLSFGMFLIAGLSAIVIALLTVSYQTLKASISNPVNSLRDE